MPLRLRTACKDNVPSQTNGLQSLQTVHATATTTIMSHHARLQCRHVRECWTTNGLVRTDDRRTVERMQEEQLGVDAEKWVIIIAAEGFSCESQELACTWRGGVSLMFVATQ
jgi:hypothetical protein